MLFNDALYESARFEGLRWQSVWGWFESLSRSSGDPLDHRDAFLLRSVEVE